jgi:hypothetical protein
VCSEPTTANVHAALWPYCRGKAVDTLVFKHDAKPGEPISGTRAYGREIVRFAALRDEASQGVVARSHRAAIRGACRAIKAAYGATAPVGLPRAPCDLAKHAVSQTVRIEVSHPGFYGDFDLTRLSWSR